MTVTAQTPDLLTAWLSRIGRCGLLTYEEEVRLFKAIRRYGLATWTLPPSPNSQGNWDYLKCGCANCSGTRSALKVVGNSRTERLDRGAS
jgi:hypothetical protein